MAKLKVWFSVLTGLLCFFVSLPLESNALEKIVFTSYRASGNGNDHDIWIMNPDGSNQTRLTTSSNY